MLLSRALNILAENHIICEFVNTVLTREQIIRVLQRLNPSFNPEKDIRKKNQMNHNAEMITLKPNYLKGTNLGPREFTQKMLGYGWNVLGYGYNQIVLAKAREVNDPDSIEFEKWDKKPELQAKVKNLYVRFSDMDPSFVKRVGFRGINDLNIDWDDPDKRSDLKKFNERHVYMFSLEHLIKSTGKMSAGKILKRIVNLASYGPNFGKYCYFIRIPSSVKLYTDPETKGDGPLGNAGVFSTQKILPQWVEGGFNVASNDVADEILHKLGLDDLGLAKPQDLSSRVDPEVMSQRLAKAKENGYGLKGIDPNFDDPVIKTLQNALKRYDKSKMVIYEPSSKTKYYLAEIGGVEAKRGGAIAIFVFLGDSEYYNDYTKMDLSINRDGTSAILLTRSEFNRSSDYQKTDELKKFLADPEVVAAAKEYAGRGEEAYDPRTHVDNRYFPEWD